MGTLYKWLDSVWNWISQKFFVRFQFDIPAEEIRKMKAQGNITFVLTDGGILDWLILTSWCRSQDFGAILVCNRKRILLLSKPLYFFQILFKTRTYKDLFLGKEEGPRLLFCPREDRKKLFTPTPTESLLAELYQSLSQKNMLSQFWLIPVHILWRRFVPGERRLGNYLVGLYTNPNWVGKFWFLLVQRKDSRVRSFPPLQLLPENSENPNQLNESEGLRVVKSIRRKILVQINQEMRVVLGPRYSSPYSVKEVLFEDPEIQKVIDEVAAKEGVDRKQIMSRAYKNLNEIVANYRYRAIEIFYVFLTWFLNKVLDGINFDEEELKKVREVMKNKPVVFVSAHRSHLDYLLVPYVLFLHDMVTPHVAAGVNLSFWPVGRLLRTGGAFFIRRSFKGDALYSICLRKYIQYLIQHRHTIKFFIEGTRSRSGKMLAPAYGILKMTLETYLSKKVEDLAFIPVSLCYDEVLEQGSYSKELAGSQKTEENAGALLRSRKVIYKNIGKVYLRFADPLYAKDIFESKENETIPETLALQKTAFQICKRINDATPITPKSILSTVLLSHPNPVITPDELVRSCFSLHRYVEWADYPRIATRAEVLKSIIEQIIPRLIKTNVLGWMESTLPRGYYCESRKRPILCFYKNNAIHGFATPAITLLAFFDCLKYFETEDFFRNYCKTALRLRNLLKFEFFFSPTQIFLKEIEKNFEHFFGENTWATTPKKEWLEKLSADRHAFVDLSLFMRMIGDLLESQKTALEFAKENLHQTFDKKVLFQKIIRFGESLLNQDKIIFPESLSIQNFQNCMLLLENFKAVRQHREKEKLQYHFEKWNSELDLTIVDIERWLAILESPLEEYLSKIGIKISKPPLTFSEPTSLA